MSLPLQKNWTKFYEFDREPVTKAKLQGIGNFLGLYGGEHIDTVDCLISIEKGNPVLVEIPTRTGSVHITSLNIHQELTKGLWRPSRRP